VEALSSSYLLSLAEIDPSTASTIAQILGPIFSSLNFLFIIRIVMSWYPQLPVDKLPYVIAFAPTEPVLEPTRRLIPPVGGVDVSPVIWVAIMSFLNEILLGQQGLLVLLSQKT
jgi:YggT family protein